MRNVGERCKMPGFFPMFDFSLFSVVDFEQLKSNWNNIRKKFILKTNLSETLEIRFFNSCCVTKAEALKTYERHIVLRDCRRYSTTTKSGSCWFAKFHCQTLLQKRQQINFLSFGQRISSLRLLSLPQYIDHDGIRTDELQFISHQHSFSESINIWCVLQVQI